MTALWIALGVLAVLLLLLVLPLRLCAVYDGALQLWLYILCFRVKLLPQHKKPPKHPKKPKPDKKPKDKSKKKQKKLSPKSLAEYAQLALELLGGFKRKIRLYELTLHASFGGKDPADAALNYGRAWAAIGAVTPLLEQAFRISRRDLSASYDETKQSIELSARATAGVSPAQLIALALHALAGWLKTRTQNQSEKAVTEHDKPDQ